MNINGIFGPYEWGSNRVVVEENKAIIHMKVRRQRGGDKPDVEVAIRNTPRQCRVDNIVSVYKRHMTPEGPDQSLVITLSTCETTDGQLEKQYSIDKDFFHWQWNQQPSDKPLYLFVPLGVATYSICSMLVSLPRDVGVGLIHKNSDPCEVLMGDEDLQPGEIREFSDERAEIRHEGNDMYRLFACGYQTRESKKD